jgi:SRSO17 transposase
MKIAKTKQSTLYEQVIPIVNNVANILNLHYLQNLFGHATANHLLFYVIGLIILEKNPTMVRISQCIRSCYHDGLFRMLNCLNLTMTSLSKMLIYSIEKYRRTKIKGWLIIDDTSITKRFSQHIGFSSKVWCGCIGRITTGIVFVTLCWTDGQRSFPVGFRIWIPKKDKNGKKRKNHKSKVDLARELIVDNIDFCRTCQYLAFDTWYCSKKFFNLMLGLKIHCISALKKNRKIIFKGREMKVSDLAVGFKGIVNLPGYGDVFIYCSRIGNSERCLVSTDKRLKYRQIRKRYKRRWPIEEFFRNIKQNLGLCNCQCRKNAAIVNHISMVFLAYVVLEILRFDYGVTHGKMKKMMIEKFIGQNEKIPQLSVRRGILKHVA